MYVFISYSSKDRRFVRRLYETLARYDIPLFLDDRDIRVGGNIPATIVEALRDATHVVYVLSKHSSKSAWVADELSIARTKQLTKRDCTILPIRIDSTPIPTAVSHIRVGDFRRWQKPAGFRRGTIELIRGLGLPRTAVISGVERRFVKRTAIVLIELKQTADVVAQLFFQMERLFFVLFQRRSLEVKHWFIECTLKQAPRALFEGALAEIARVRKTLPQPAPRITRLGKSIKRLLADYTFFYGLHTEAWTYKRIRVTERHAVEVSAALRSLLAEAIDPSDPSGA